MHSRLPHHRVATASYEDGVNPSLTRCAQIMTTSNCQKVHHSILYLLPFEDFRPTAVSQRISPHSWGYAMKRKTRHAFAPYCLFLLTLLVLGGTGLAAYFLAHWLQQVNFSPDPVDTARKLNGAAASLPHNTTKAHSFWHPGISASPEI